MFHRCKYGKVENDYQYCVECGKAIHVPCKHVWVNEGKYGIYAGNSNQPSGYGFIDRCEKCGEIKIINTKLD